MQPEDAPPNILANWADTLGAERQLISRCPERDLWLVRGADDREFYLKQFGPWRNLPIENEARVLQFLSGHGVRVAEFIPTDNALPFAGSAQKAFVLMPRLASDQFDPPAMLDAEFEVGALVARLHLALSRYDGQLDSYTEDIDGSLRRDLMLPPELKALFMEHREAMLAVVSDLPTQPIHGDLTPENIVLRHPVSESGFIDFEHLPIAPRIWDVAKYLSRRLRMRWRASHPTVSYSRDGHISPFVRGYHRTNPLHPSELAALPSMMAAANVIEVSYFAEIAAGKLDRRMLSDHHEVLADSIDAAQWHLENWGSVEELVNKLTTENPEKSPSTSENQSIESPC